MLSWLASANDWLIVFDNASSLDDIRLWLPAGKGHILITSRHPAWSAVATRIDVDILTRAESVSFLTRYVRGMQPEIAGEVAAELGDLPLALAQAAAYLEASDIPPATYLKRFRQRRSQMLSKGKDLIYGGSLDTAWSVTLQKLQAEAPEAVVLLELAAICAPEPIPLSLFAAEPGLLSAPLSTTAQANPESAIDDAVSAALAYSLCRRDGDAVQMHRLVQAVISTQPSPQKRAAVTATLARLLAAASPGDPDDPATWSAWAALAPHIIHIHQSVAARPDTRIVLEHLISWFCWYLFISGDLAAAKPLAVSIYETRRSADGPDARVTLGAAANLAAILRAAGEGQAATTLARDVLDRQRRVFGDDDPDTLHAANNLVSCLTRSDDFEAARDIAEDTLKRCRRTLGPDDSMTLATAGNLAVLLADLGEKKRAVALAEDTATRWRHLVGDDHRETMWAIGVLIHAMETAGEIESAHQLATESLARHRRLFGEDHRETQAAADRSARLRASLNEHQRKEKQSTRDKENQIGQLWAASGLAMFSARSAHNGHCAPQTG